MVAKQVSELQNLLKQSNKTILGDQKPLWVCLKCFSSRKARHPVTPKESVVERSVKVSQQSIPLLALVKEYILHNNCVWVVLIHLFNVSLFSGIWEKETGGRGLVSKTMAIWWLKPRPWQKHISYCIQRLSFTHHMRRLPEKHSCNIVSDYYTNSIKLLLHNPKYCFYTDAITFLKLQINQRKNLWINNKCLRTKLN